MRRALLATLLALCAGAAQAQTPPVTGPVPLVSGPFDVSQFNSKVNGVIQAINACFNGTTGTSCFDIPSAFGPEPPNEVFASPYSGTGLPGFRQLAAHDLPFPGFTAIGGVEAIAPVSHQWIDSINVLGVPNLSQPAASDLSNGVTGSGAVVLAVSPALTGTPTAPTAAFGDNSTTLATTAFVQTAFGGSGAVFTPEQYESPAFRNPGPITDSYTITAGSVALASASNDFNAGMVGQVFSLAGAGTGIGTYEIVTQGTGYTPGTQILTAVVGAGTCSVLPQIQVFIGPPNLRNPVVTPGTCTVQIPNPVSFTGGGGSGLTANFHWLPLVGTVSTFTDAKHITLSTPSSLTLSATSGSILIGQDARAAISAAFTAANAAALSTGAATLQLCGAYMVSSALTLVANSNLSITSSCPGTTVYPYGSGSGVAIFLVGGANIAPSVSITADASYGDTAVQVSSATSFTAGGYIGITAPTTHGGIREMLNRIVSISGTTINLETPMAFDLLTSLSPTALAARLNNNIALRDITVDCTYAPGSVFGIELEFIAYADVSNVTTRNCHNSTTTATQKAGGYDQQLMWGGRTRVYDQFSGTPGVIDGLTIATTTNADILADEEESNGFGINVVGVNNSRLDLRNNWTIDGRGIKLFGSSNNSGSLYSLNVPQTAWPCIWFDGGSQYNNFSQATSNGCFQGLASNGLDNTNNTIQQYRVANISGGQPISIDSVDTGWTVANVHYGPNADPTTNNNLGNAWIGTTQGQVNANVVGNGGIGQYLTARASPTTTNTVTFTNGSAVIGSTNFVTLLKALCAPNDGSICVQPVMFTTTGGLPTNFTVGTTYYIDPASFSGQTFKVGTTVANALAHTYVTAGSAGSGTQTATNQAAMASGATPVDVLALNLPPGYYNCRGAARYIADAGTTPSIISTGLSKTTATLTNDTTLGEFTTMSLAFTAGRPQTVPFEGGLVNVSATTPLFLEVAATFAVSTAESGGSLQCWRVN